MGVANCRICYGVNPLQIIQSFLRTQASSPTPLSLHLAHLRWPSKLAITWPHVPRFCPGEDLIQSKNKMVEFVVEIKKRLSKHVHNLHAPNEKDAMTSRCLERKYNAPPGKRTFQTGPAGIIYRTSFSGIGRDRSR